MKRLLIGVCAAAMASAAVAQTAPPPAPAPRVRPAPPAPRLVAGQPVETRNPELAGDTPAFPGQTRAPYRATVAPKVTVVTDKLDKPWGLAFLSGGRFLVTEKPGALRIVGADGALSEPIKGLPEIYVRGQVGLLDVELDKAYAANHRIFFSFAQPVGDNMHIAIASARLDEQALTLSDVKVIFQARPDLPKTRGSNQGGRMVVARDGTIFSTIGDRSSSPPWDMAQKLDTHLGKMIHITVDGKPAPGNPFMGKPGVLPEIWSSGHRSEMGLAFDPQGRLWENENGPRGGDELNLIEPGKNYGWPVIVHGIDYPGEKINGGLTAKAGMEQARYYWDPVVAPSGLAFYNASLFPQWKGSVLVGALAGQRLVRLTLNGTSVVDEEPLLTDFHARIRDVRVGPDGAVYLLTDDTRLLKLTPP